MGKSSKKPRQKNMDTRRVEGAPQEKKKKQDDWSFEDIVRSKKRGY